MLISTIGLLRILGIIGLHISKVAAHLAVPLRERPPELAAELQLRPRSLARPLKRLAVLVGAAEAPGVGELAPVLASATQVEPVKL